MGGRARRQRRQGRDGEEEWERGKVKSQGQRSRAVRRGGGQQRWVR